MGLSSSRRRTRRARAALTLVLSVLVVAGANEVALAQAPDAKTSLASGTKAAAAKDWTAAAAAFDAANHAAPSSDALEGLANAHYQLKHDAEAYAAYDAWLKTYGAKAPAAKKTTAQARLKELGERTGLVSIESSEPGAVISVDDKPMGVTPLAAPLRLSTGPHRVRVSKDGFVPFDQVPNVNAGETSPIVAKLVTQPTKGHVTVREKTGKPLRVVLDGVDVGDAPWSGDLDAGPHEISGRGVATVAAPEKITVERGKTREVELVASSSIATLKIATSDGKGVIYLDNKVVGEGTFTSEVPSGTHSVRITREGYDPFEETLALKDKETLARSVTLKLSSHIETGTIQNEGRRLEGLYGGFGLLMSFLPGGMKSSMQKTCDDSRPAELTSCDGQGGGFGGGLDGFIGYHWDPIGIELFGGVQYDQANPSLKWGPSSTDPGLGPDPARTEDFSIHRVGGFGIMRIRLTKQTDKLRFSVAAGVGLSYRSLLLTRDTSLASNPSSRDAFVPDAESYLSPILSLEPSFQYRLTPTAAVAIGMSLLVESPRSFDQTPTSKAEAGHGLSNGPGVPPSGVTTPAYELASGTQVYIGPFIGMMFGP